jgi:hypothetical protein
MRRLSPLRGDQATCLKHCRPTATRPPIQPAFHAGGGSHNFELNPARNRRFVATKPPLPQPLRGDQTISSTSAGFHKMLPDFIAVRLFRTKKKHPIFGPKTILFIAMFEFKFFTFFRPKKRKKYSSRY